MITLKTLRLNYDYKTIIKRPYTNHCKIFLRRLIVSWRSLWPRPIITRGWTMPGSGSRQWNLWMRLFHLRGLGREEWSVFALKNIILFLFYPLSEVLKGPSAELKGQEMK